MGTSKHCCLTTNQTDKEVVNLFQDKFNTKVGWIGKRVSIMIKSKNSNMKVSYKEDS